jgi:AraC-like DNA-binding protein
MILQFLKPSPALENLVNNIMINKVSFSTLTTKPSFLFPPLPEQCLFFYPQDCMKVEYASGKKQQLSSCVIVGPQTAPLHITMGYEHLVIKVGFQPGGLHRLLGIPMYHLLRQEAFDAGDLLGPEVYLVNEQLKEAASFQEMQTIVEQFLLKKKRAFKSPLPIDHVLPHLIQQGGLLPVDQLASLACLSNRQFERTFKDRIGVSPKFFSRLVRFANAWVHKESRPEASWAEIAYTCGYYDQMHLIRDFKEFAGANPSLIEISLSEAAINLQNKVFF